MRATLESENVMNACPCSTLNANPTPSASPIFLLVGLGLLGWAGWTWWKDRQAALAANPSTSTTTPTPQPSGHYQPRPGTQGVPLHLIGHALIGPPCAVGRSVGREVGRPCGCAA